MLAPVVFFELRHDSSELIHLLFRAQPSASSSSFLDPALTPARAKGVNVNLLPHEKSSAVSRQQNPPRRQAVPLSGRPSLRSRLPMRLWLELALGVLSGALMVLAVVSPHWMEQWLGFAPDAGDGSAEWGVAVVWSAVTLLMFGLAGRTWRSHIRSSPINLALER